jgi:WD40 repeat protein
MSVSWSPNGDLLAVSAGENIHLYKFPELERIILLKVGAFTHSLAFSQDGIWVASGSRDGKLRMWQLTSLLASRPESASPYLEIEAHAKGVNTVAFSPEGRFLASGGNDAVVRFWDLHSGELMGEVVGGTFAVPSMVFTLDGSTLAIVNGDVVRLRDVASERIEGTFLSEVSLYSVALSPDGMRLATGSGENTVQLWDIKSAYRTGQEVYPEPEQLISPNGNIGGYRGLVWQVAFSPNGKVLAAASGDSTIGLWRVDTGEFLGSLVGHTRGVTSVAFHPDGHFLASGGLDGVLRIWGVLE